MACFVYNALKRQNSWPPGVSALDALNDYKWQRHLAEKYVCKINKRYFEILTIYKCVQKQWMTIGFNIWMIWLGLSWFLCCIIWASSGGNNIKSIKNKLTRHWVHLLFWGWNYKERHKCCSVIVGSFSKKQNPYIFTT